MTDVLAAGWVPDLSTFGARLAAVRHRLGWNVKEAAAACGIPAQSWRQWEAGGNVRDRRAAAEKIATATGCSYGWLFMDPSSSNTPT